MEGIKTIEKDVLQKYEKHEFENVILMELWKSIFSKQSWYRLNGTQFMRAIHSFENWGI